MPFVQVDVDTIIQENRDTDPEFRKVWDESREEYRLLGEMIAIRRQQHITQGELARKVGSRQQVISRIEKKEQSPTLKTFCNMLDALGYKLEIVKREKV